jgi:16S rRNA A1518/A1519 N6-dimethyltransferase RsmA/KsgA/DIM1 with predicted DNA glycosylase/AP lyase activity
MRLDLQQLVKDAATAAAPSQAEALSPTAAAISQPQQQQDQPQMQAAEQQQQHQVPGSPAPPVPPAAGLRQPNRRVKVVANLPYNITKDFLLALLPQGSLISELSIMIQEEVAQRLVDPTPSRADYRAMSVITHYYSKPVYRFRYCQLILTSSLWQAWLL